jgi:hypothetical protein
MSGSILAIMMVAALLAAPDASAARTLRRGGAPAAAEPGRALPSPTRRLRSLIIDEAALTLEVEAHARFYDAEG